MSARKRGSKRTIYFEPAMLIELQAEAYRLGRSLSWVVQQCIAAAFSEIKALQTVKRNSEDEGT